MSAHANMLTLVDSAKRMDPDGQSATIAEILSQANPLVADAVFVQANDRFGHRTTVRTGLPDGTWRSLNYGVPNEKSSTAQVTDTIGSLESYSDVDKLLADSEANPAMFRAQEDAAFIAGMGNTVENTAFYGNTDVNSDRFMGLTPRYNDPAAPSAANVIDSSGSATAPSSIWIITWGPQATHMIFPRGSSAGLTMDNRGQWTVQDEAGNNFEAYRSHFAWRVGMTVRDWRYNVRIANVNMTATAGASGADDAQLELLIDNVIEGLGQIEDFNHGRTVIYMNRRQRTAFTKAATWKHNVNLSYEEFAGHLVPSIQGFPIHIADELLDGTEDQYDA